MKLLSLTIGNVKENFRSLHPDFKVVFHTLNNVDAMLAFNPFCFAGLNGSGKSNVLEALSNIFYHLECCVASFKPDSFKKHFKKEECNPDAFTLEYLIGQNNGKPYILENFHKVTITKVVGKRPLLEIQEFPFNSSVKKIPISISATTEKIAPAKIYLPDNVVAYSSGENEIISLPFIKSRLIHLDEYVQGVVKEYKNYYQPENSLIYIDEEMSQAVLLANLIFEDEKTTLAPLKKAIGVVGLRSFRMQLNLHKLKSQKKKRNDNILIYIEDRIELLKQCATSYRAIGNEIWLDFFIDDETKKAFRINFLNSFDLFRLFQLLYELNAHFIPESIKEEVYKSKGYYTDGKLPVGSPDNNVFYFLDYLVRKEIKGVGEKDLLLREFSDGEHQFLHTLGICLMLNDRRTLLLLDEPETHFNPAWRARFIKVLNDSIVAGNKGKTHNVHLLKDVLLTSHSPFIISDCMPNNVLFFERNKETHLVEAKKASAMGFNTYGTSVEIILDELFHYNQSIGDKSNEVLTKIKFDNIKTKTDVEKTKALFSHLGDSIEKDLVLARLNQLKPKK